MSWLKYAFAALMGCVTTAILSFPPGHCMVALRDAFPPRAQADRNT